jgi:sugar (pentulose or hexulose) kinase
MSFIGIDLGTTFIKGAVLDVDGFHLRSIRRVPFPAPISGLPVLFREYDPLEIMIAVRSLLADLLPQAPDCEGLVMCSQMHGLVLTTDTGEPRSSLTTWQDQRVMMPHPSGAGTYFEAMSQRLTTEQKRLLGNELRPGQPVGLLFRQAEQGILPEKDWTLASLPDFVLANLCATTPVTEITNAMAHGVLNLETLEWLHPVIEKLGLSNLRWPEIRPHGTTVGNFTFGDRSIPCFTPVGDYQCALLGSLLQPGELSLNISTGSQVSLLQPQVKFGDFQTRPYFDGQFLNGITHVPAGRSLNLLVKLLSELAEAQNITLADPWPYISRTAAEVRNISIKANLAFFTSSCGDHGEITNIREEELTVGHLFRAAFQNMADNYLSSALLLDPDRNWGNLVFSGGLAQKIPVLREIICEKFRCDFRMCPTSEDTLLGLLALALVFSHRQPDFKSAVNLLKQSFIPTVE